MTGLDIGPKIVEWTGDATSSRPNQTPTRYLGTDTGSLQPPLSQTQTSNNCDNDVIGEVSVDQLFEFECEKSFTP